MMSGRVTSAMTRNLPPQCTYWDVLAIQTHSERIPSEFNQIGSRSG